MGREVLSLKSIYKFLTLNDYPVYSEGIIKKDNRAGLTLTKFYLDNILVELKNGKNGKIIWRTEGSRNRYISEICNRSDRLSLYREYAEEVMLAADYDTVLRQIRQYMSFLLERQYNTENFFKKIPAMIEMYDVEDDAFSQDALVFFNEAMEERKVLEGQGFMVDTFCCGWILTMFTLHALMGNGEGEEHLHRIRSDRGYSLIEMLKRYQEFGDDISKEITFFDEIKEVLGALSLKSGHLSGREVELFELRELLAQAESVKSCVEDKLADCIGVVLYKDELDKNDEVLECISGVNGKRGILIIDDINNTKH